eukprot:3600030-Rhodomonas_salina.4
MRIPPALRRVPTGILDLVAAQAISVSDMAQPGSGGEYLLPHTRKPGRRAAYVGTGHNIATPPGSAPDIVSHHKAGVGQYLTPYYSRLRPVPDTA